MPKLLSAMRWLTAIGTVLVFVLLAWQCIDIYLAGNAPENLDADGVHLQAVYRMEDVAERLARYSIPLMAYGGLLVLSGVLHALFDSRPAAWNQGPQAVVTDSQTGSYLNVSRIILYVLAVLFIVLGVMNGGWYDVLVKAINICTECIGLG